MTKLQRVVQYARVSTQEQTEGLSLETQRRESLKWVQSQPQATTLYEFSDVESGLDNDREGYNKLLDLVRQHKIDTVVVWRYDRFGRDDAELLVRYNELVRHNVELISVTEGHRDHFMMKLGFLLANEESRRISARVTPGMRGRAEQGLWQGAPPKGYRRDPEHKGHLIIHEEEAQLIRTMFEMAARGDSVWVIAAHVNALNHDVYLPPRNIKRTLRNPVYCGRVVWGKERFSKLDGGGKRERPPETWVTARGQHEPLVEEETWERVQQHLGKPQTKADGQPKKTLLAGMVRCMICGYACHGAWNAQSRTRYHSYRCPKRSHGNMGGRKLDAFVLGHVNALPFGQQVIDWVMRYLEENVPASDDVAAYQNRARLEKRLAEARKYLMDKILTPDMFIAERDEIMQALAVLDRMSSGQEQRLTAYRHAVETCREMMAVADVRYDLRPGTPLDRQHRTLADFVDHVLIGRRGSVPIIIFQPWVTLVLEATEGAKEAMSAHGYDCQGECLRAVIPMCFVPARNAASV